MKFLKFAVLALFTFVVSCKDQSEKETQELYDALVVGHDEVMPKSMAIPTIRENMMKAVENASEEKKNQALDLSTKLLKAEDKMNEWMVAFGEAINQEGEGQLAKYKKLNEEIIQLKTDTDSAIDQAKVLTAEFTEQ
jgi:hypothetical protein